MSIHRRIAVIFGVAALGVAAPAHAVTFQGAVGSPSSTNLGAGFINLAAADLDHDGNTDIVATYSGDAELGRLMSNGNGSLTVTQTPLTAADANPFAVGQLNGDVFPDAVLTGGSSVVQVALNNGAGLLAPQTGILGTSTPSSARLGDLNGDGRDDLLVTIGASAVLNYALNTGSGTFGALVPLPGGANGVDAQVGDITGDGLPDIVAALAPSSGTFGVAMWTNTGSATVPAFTTTPAITTFGTTSATDRVGGIHLADVTDDHRLDVVTTRGFSTGMKLVVLRNLGGALPSDASTAFSESIGDSSFGIPPVVLADLDLDGKLDAAIPDNTDVSIYPGVGTNATPFGGGVPIPQSQTLIPKSTVAGDFNGDGVPDLAFNSGVSPGLTVDVLINSTTAPTLSPGAPSVTFGSVQPTGVASAPQTVTITNNGNANLTISSADVTGADFVKSADTCTGAAIAHAQTCTVQVRYWPSAAGPSTGALHLADATHSLSANVALSGIGGPPPSGTNGTDGTNGTSGTNGTNGTSGTNGTNGTDGAPGATGGTGGTGPVGPRGPAGRNATVTCKAGKPRKGKVKVTCTVKQAKASRVVAARLSRNGRVVARAGGPSLVFRFAHRPLRGTYRLTVTTRHADGALVALTTTVFLT